MPTTYYRSTDSGRKSGRNSGRKPQSKSRGTSRRRSSRMRTALWVLGALVAVTNSAGKVEVIERRRVSVLIDDGKTARRSANSEATNIFAELLEQNIRTLTFANTRRLTELIYTYTRDKLGAIKPALAKRIWGIEPMDHPTDPEIVAAARKYFHAADRMHPTD